MLYKAKNGTVKIGDSRMYYAAFGKGSKNLIMLPGVGDGLKNAKGMAIPYAFLYRAFAKKYRVYVISRKLPQGDHATTLDMAEDLREAMRCLHIEKADVLGVSQGGMVAQHLAAASPEVVGKLVLVVTAARPNDCIKAVLSRWMELARKKDYKELMQDNLRSMYTERYIRKNQWLLPLIVRFSEPTSYGQFLTLAEACINHDAYEKLPGISAETLVIGGELDKTVGPEGSRELAGRIPGAKLFMYPDLGHGLYGEARDFNERVLKFLETGE